MDKLNQQIEDFLDGNLIGDELDSFLKRKDQELEFTNEIDLRLGINQSLRDKGFSEIREILDRQRNEFFIKDPFHNFRKDLLKTWHLAAASFSLILVVGGLWYILSINLAKIALFFYPINHTQQKN